MRIPSLSSFLGAVFLGAFAVSAHATLYVYDPFNQAPGALNGTASSGGDPAAVWPTENQNYTTVTGTAQVISGSLSGNILTQGNAAQLQGGASASIFRLFGTTLGGPGTDLWISFLITAASGKNSQVLSLFNGPNPTGEALAIGVNGSTRLGLSVRTGSGTTTTGNPGVNTSLAPDNGTHLIAVHLQLVAGTGNSTFSVFVDPDLSSYGTLAPTGGSSGSFSGNNSLPFSFDRIRLGTFAASTTTAFDELRIADTWAEVSPAMVPEPAAASLLTLSAGLLARRRSRRVR